MCSADCGKTVSCKFKRNSGGNSAWPALDVNFSSVSSESYEHGWLPRRIVFPRLCRKVTYRVVTCSDVTRMSLNLNVSVTLADSSSGIAVCSITKKEEFIFMRIFSHGRD